MWINIRRQFRNAIKGGVTMEENKAVLLTQEGYEKLEKELDYLRTEKRAEKS